jgi:hypothetical protein
MANLFDQDIGLNYKGILNLGSTINTALSGTLQAVTDGNGNASPLQLSTTKVAISSESNQFDILDSGDIYTYVKFSANGGFVEQLYGDGAGSVGYFNRYASGWWMNNSIAISGIYTAPSARLHVRGDGTNNVVRFEGSGLTEFLTINNNGGIRAETTDTNAEMFRLQRNASYFLSYTPVGLFRIQTLSGGAPNGVNNTKWIYFANKIDSASTASQAGLMIDTTVACATGQHSPRIFEVGYSINNPGAQTGTATGIFLNATETALNGMGHNLMDLGTGGATYVSRFSVGRGQDTSIKFNSTSSTRFKLITADRIGSLGTELFAIGAGTGPTSTATYFGSNNDDIHLGSFSGTTWTSRVISPVAFIGLQFGGNTNNFPAIKRNGTAIEFKLADDTSGFCAITAASVGIGSGITISQNTNTLAFNTTLGNVVGNVGTLSVFGFGMGADTSTSSTSNYFSISKSITPSAGSANFRNLIVDYTINASGVQTGTATGIYLNATETNLNEMAHNLMDLQVGGVSQFKVDRLGAVSIGNTVTSAASVASTHKVTVVIDGVTYYLLASNV